MISQGTGRLYNIELVLFKIRRQRIIHVYYFYIHKWNCICILYINKIVNSNSNLYISQADRYSEVQNLALIIMPTNKYLLFKNEIFKKPREVL